MKKRMVSIIVSLLVCLWSFPVSMISLAANDYHPFDGSGTASDPYLIDSAYKLRLLAEIINDEDLNPDFRYCYYKQTADIDLGNKNFTPIGKFYGADGTTTTKNAMFSGSYDGNYHSITNLYIDYDKRYCGLFGKVGQGGHDNSDCKIKNLSVTGSVKTTAYDVGGFVGELSYGAEVINCNFNGTIEGNGIAGGIVGNSYCGGNVTSCYANAEVISTNEAGGLIGAVSVGKNTDTYSTDTLLSNNYFVGHINGNSSKSGGIVGNAIIYDTRENSTITYDKCYYLNSACEVAANGVNSTGCFALSASMMKAVNEMLGSPFAENNNESINDGYPVFEWQITPYQFKGEGTKENPYLITSKQELETLSVLVNNVYFNPKFGYAHYLQTSDIDLQNESWTPIGLGYDGDDGMGAYNYKTRMFYGSYDGGNHYIYNLNVDKPWQKSGLFGHIRKNGNVSNLVVYGSVKNGTYENGGIVGSIHYGASVKNCAFIGDVESSNRAGGIAGAIYAGGEIENCYHIGKVTGANDAGGIVGYINFGKFGADGDSAYVTNCYHANGEVSGSQYSSGIAGRCVYQTGIDNMVYISNCFAAQNSAANNISKDATSDTTVAISDNLLKKAAEDLGAAYATDINEINGGYPVFVWQANRKVGDVNTDGEFNVADLVLLQKWLLAAPDATLSDWKAADLCKDNRIDVFDLVMMRKALLQQI